MPISSAPSMQPASLLTTSTLSLLDIQSLFSQAKRFELEGFPKISLAPQKVVACVFFEPSTRTRMSFQMAGYRLGMDVVTLETSSSSLSKGETLTDTILNVVAMRPDALVVRYGNATELDELLPKLDVPVLNAGSGVAAHPTQALLDAYTIERECGKVSGVKVLIVGDIKHSRVARSSFDVLSRLGAEIGICGPPDFLPSEKDVSMERVHRFDNLDEATAWTDVYMGLRIQLERHASRELDTEAADAYHHHFGLTQERLKILRKDAIIMHPGPINHGVEFSFDVMSDSRNRILKQVNNGVLVRAALLSRIISVGGK